MKLSDEAEDEQQSGRNSHVTWRQIIGRTTRRAGDTYMVVAEPFTAPKRIHGFDPAYLRRHQHHA